MNLTLKEKVKIQNEILSNLGYAPSLDRIEVSASYRRFDTKKKGHLNGFFRIMQFGNVLFLHYGDWSVQGASYRWDSREGANAGMHYLTKEENYEIQGALKFEREKEAREKKLALDTMKDRFDNSPYFDSLDIEHEYLKKKGLTKSYIAKYDQEKELLLFPFYNSLGLLMGIQEIDSYGNKKIVRHSTKKGSFALLKHKDSDLSRVYACEGYATGISILEATRGAVIICIDAGNLAEGIRSGSSYLNISPSLVNIVADNDESGTGEKEAIKACNMLGCSYTLVPYLGMDANDYFKEFGIEFLSSLLLDGEDRWGEEYWSSDIEGLELED